MGAELQIMKLQEEIDTLKKKHFVEVVALKTEIEQHKSEKIAFKRELDKIKKPKINLSVSKKYFIRKIIFQNKKQSIQL